jgi:hypothetical protein
VSLYPNSNMVVDADAPAAPRTPPAAQPAAPSSRYPNSDHAHADAKPAEPVQPPKPADEPAIDVPDTVRELRKSDSSFYDVLGTYRSVLGTGTSQDLLPGQSEPVRREVALLFRDSGLTSREAQQVVDAIKAQPSEEVRAQWQRDAERYLDTIPDSDVDAAIKLLERDRRVAHILESSGAINNVEVVKLIVDKARAERARGRLK